jgi:hypothetical protein
VAARTAIGAARAAAIARGDQRASRRRMKFRSPHRASRSHALAGSFAGALLGLSALAGCGDDSAGQPVDARTVDAPVCELAGYPETIRAVTIEQRERTQLTLDGTGTRCEQLERALLAASRPAELLDIDVEGATSTCTHDDDTNREIVRFRFPTYGGLPIYWPVQDALVHVDADNQIVFMAGTFVPAGHAPIDGCMSGPALASAIPGRPLEYEKFAACVPRGPGMYTIAGTDVIETGEEGIYLDGADHLRRVRAFDVFVAPANLTSEVRNSDAYCCSGATEEHCVGKTLYLDALTGETIAQAPHCHTC